MQTTNKRLKTNSKVVKDAIQNYIIESLDTSCYPDVKDDIKSKLELVCTEFQFASVYENNILRHKTWQNAFIDWLKGMPASLGITIWDSEILELMQSFGLPLPENKSEREGTELFYALIYLNFLDLCKKHNVDYYSYLKY